MHVALSAPALFLHTGWRSGGTWIWETLRRAPGACGFYEPLHEFLADIDAARIRNTTAESWESGHRGVTSYFADYAPLLKESGAGVRGYEPRFGYERFFLDAGETDDSLAAYIETLLASAASRGEVPVLKFCRSLGRVAWMQQRFPRALHAVVLRNPVAQWRSSVAQLADGNRYFLVGPLRVLARNRDATPVREAVARLSVRLPSLPAPARRLDEEVCWRYLARFDEATRYRGFIAHWAATAISALSAPNTLIIDMDALSGDAAHRSFVEASIHDHTGLQAALAAHEAGRGAVPPEGAAAAHEAAAGLVEAHGAALSAAARALILAKLELAGGTSRSAECAPQVASWRDAEMGAGMRRAVYFAALGASMPLRRLRGRRKEGLLF